MEYPKNPDFKKLVEFIEEYGRLKHEYGADGVEGILTEAGRMLEQAIERLKALPGSVSLRAKEPDSLPAIRELRAEGPRRIWKAMDERKYADRLHSALLGRMAGCTLGAPVELWSIDEMERWAAYIGDDFPNRHYWSRAKNPIALHYEKSLAEEYTLEKMSSVPVDDDIAYTLLGLLIAEEHGVVFTVEDVGAAWLKYLPYACTAEDVALKNLKAGIPAGKAADAGNPYCQWIGADIRSDAWGYIAPGCPEKAAEMAWTDATLSHRRNGVYGAMLFSAAISAAFSMDDPLEALRTGLTEIPRGGALHGDALWALAEGGNIRNYSQARAAVDARFKGMSPVHTNNNACLTIFGLMIGNGDFTKTISETVAMGMDNDCTAATAGSLLGAVLGAGGIPAYWHERFGDTVRSYLIGHEAFSIDDLLVRFAAQARKSFVRMDSPKDRAFPSAG
jgi:ADP-ribosylglycohydrolase